MPFGLFRGLESYRVLFPVGLLLGVVGVALWPLHVYGLWEGYPGVAHARVMVQGFVGAFMLGFIGTAGPFMLAAPRFTRLEVGVQAVGLVASVVAHLVGRLALGDALFAAVLLLFLVGLVARWFYRKDLPPAAFVSAGMGLLLGLVGRVMLLLDGVMGWSNEVYLLSRLFLYQGFILLPILGVGGFLLPLFMGYPRRQTMPSGRQPSRAWWVDVMSVAAAALLIIFSFVLEAWGSLRMGYGLRAAVILVYMWRYIPIHLKPGVGGTLSWTSRYSLAAVLAGYVLAAVWLEYHMAWLHVVFMTGFGMLIFAVAARVIVAHGGHKQFFTARWPMMAWVFGLVWLAMATRVSADWMLDSRLSHFAYAALCWIPAALLWGWRLFRYLGDNDPEGH